MPIHPCIFDLDGTLVDSVADIALATNRALATHGLPGHDQEKYREFLGEGLRVLIQKALGPAHARLIEVVMHNYRAEYAAHLVDSTAPYPGIQAMLADLSRADVPLAILSNKPHEFAVPIVERLFPGTQFVAIYGHRERYERKPDPRSALEIAELFAVAPEQCLFVGDTPIDIATATNARMKSVGVSWGFRSAAELEGAGASYLVNHAQELVALALGD